MTTESLQPTQGFLDISNAGFLPVSSDSFLPVVSSPSLLESKQQQVAAISDAKKQALDPSVTSSIVPFNSLQVIDGDTLKNRLTGEKLRLDNVGSGSSLDAYEVPHGLAKTEIAEKYGVTRSYVYQTEPHNLFLIHHCIYSRLARARLFPCSADNLNLFSASTSISDY